MKQETVDTAARDALHEAVCDRLGLYGIPPERCPVNRNGALELAPEDVLRLLETELQTGFRSPFALGRALDDRRKYHHLGILAIQLDLRDWCDPENAEQVNALLRQLARNVRELDACYRSIDTTLVMLMPETGTEPAILTAAARIKRALDQIGVRSVIGASSTVYRNGARGHEYLGSALVALVEAQRNPDRIAFVQV